MYINRVDQWTFGGKSLLLAFIGKFTQGCFGKVQFLKIIISFLPFAHKELTIKHRSQLVSITWVAENVFFTCKKEGM